MPTCKDGSCQCVGTVNEIEGSCVACISNSGSPSTTSATPDTGCTASAPACESGETCKECYGSDGDGINPNAGCDDLNPKCNNGVCGPGL